MVWEAWGTNVLGSSIQCQSLSWNRSMAVNSKHPTHWSCSQGGQEARISMTARLHSRGQALPTSGIKILRLRKSNTDRLTRQMGPAALFNEDLLLRIPSASVNLKWSSHGSAAHQMKHPDVIDRPGWAHSVSRSYIGQIHCHCILALLALQGLLRLHSMIWIILTLQVERCRGQFSEDPM